PLPRPPRPTLFPYTTLFRSSMGYAGGGEIESAMNRPENHARIEEGFRKYIPLAAKAGVTNVITFSGNRKAMSDDEGDAGLGGQRSEEHTSELQSRVDLVCRL